ncbi:MAG: transcriptional regulator, partial [Mesorhizobium sp.]
MITAQQMRAARALAGIDQKTLAERAGVSLPTDTVARLHALDGRK